MPRTVAFHGLLAIGNTKAEAVSLYRSLASGRNVAAYVDEDKTFAFVTNANSKLAEMFNPLTGDMDLTQSQTILKSLSFEAKSGQVETNYTVCSDGCGAHIVYDSESLVKFCPACTTSLSMSDEDMEEEDEGNTSEDDADMDLSDMDISDEEDTSEEEDDGSDEIVASDDEEEDEDMPEEDDSEDDMSEEDDLAEEDDLGEEDDSEEEEVASNDEPLVVASDSRTGAIKMYMQERGKSVSSDEVREVEYVVCSSEDCGLHILAEEEIFECPKCHSSVEEPASEDDSEEEEENESDLSILDSEEEDESDSDSEEEDEDLAEAASLEDGDDDEDEELKDESSPEVKEKASKETSIHEVKEVAVTVLDSNPDLAAAAFSDLDVSYSAGVHGRAIWTAYLKGIPVAISTKATAGNSADIFDQPEFGRAVVTAAKHVGVKDTLSQMGFEPITIKVNIPSYVDRVVASSTEEVKKEFKAKADEYQQRFIAALATSAIGLNRGFFTGIANPLKRELYDSLSTAGIRHADVLIDNVFCKSADEYHSTILAKAVEILDKPAEVQESLAKAVLDTNYMRAAEASSSSSFEERLSGIGTVVASEATVEAKGTTVPSGHEKMVSVVSTLGRRRS